LQLLASACAHEKRIPAGREHLTRS
jgi:hypothetical protein